MKKNLIGMGPAVVHRNLCIYICMCRALHIRGRSGFSSISFQMSPSTAIFGADEQLMDAWCVALIGWEGA